MADTLTLLLDAGMAVWIQNFPSVSASVPLLSHSLVRPLLVGISAEDGSRNEDSTRRSRQMKDLPMVVPDEVGP